MRDRIRTVVLAVLIIWWSDYTLWWNKCDSFVVACEEWNAASMQSSKISKTYYNLGCSDHFISTLNVRCYSINFTHICAKTTVSSLLICNEFLQISLKLLNLLFYNFAGALFMGILIWVELVFLVLIWFGTHLVRAHGIQCKISRLLIWWEGFILEWLLLICMQTGPEKLEF